MKVTSRLHFKKTKKKPAFIIFSSEGFSFCESIMEKYREILAFCRVNLGLIIRSSLGRERLLLVKRSFARSWNCIVECLFT
jgi:hypothetical protein